MPNQDNIEAPITLVSFGRSGTSLISQIFALHPDCHSVNETANLIFDVWHAIKFSSGFTPPLFEGDNRVSDENRASRIVRQVFLTCFPNDRSHWFHKPIGIPTVLQRNYDDDQWPEAAEWYWQVIRQTFPKARFFTILRHPCDIVLSLQARSGFDQAIIWRLVRNMAYLLTHPASPVEYAIHFEELIQNNEKVLKDLFSYLNLSFTPRVLNAFSQNHVASEGKPPINLTLTNRSMEWDQIDPGKVSGTSIENITNLFNRFGYQLQWPAHLSKSNITSNDELEERELKQIIADLHLKINSLHRDYLLKIQTLTHENHRQIETLKHDKITLEEQLRQLQDTVSKQKTHITKQTELLETIYHTRAWKLMRWYWTLKEKVLKAKSA